MLDPMSILIFCTALLLYALTQLLMRNQPWRPTEPANETADNAERLRRRKKLTIQIEIHD
jgi:hypothetical protein